MSKCLKCGQMSMTTRPEGRKIRQGVTISNEYSFICMNPNCRYVESTISEKTEFYDKMNKPWYKFW